MLFNLLNNPFNEIIVLQHELIYKCVFPNKNEYVNAIVKKLNESNLMLRQNNGIKIIKLLMELKNNIYEQKNI